MSGAVAATASMIAVAGVLVGACLLAVTRDLRTALPVTLDLLMAAGLLRLTAAGTWQAIATAAAIVAVRKLVVLELASAPHIIENDTVVV